MLDSTSLNARWNAFRERLDFTLGNRMDFYERLASQIEQGWRPKDAILAMINQYERINVHNSSRRMLDTIIQSFERHRDALDSALAPYIPISELMLISAGIKRNEVAEGFRSAAELTQRVGKFRKQAVQKMTYPLVLYGIGVVLFVGGYFTLDNYTKFSAVSEWDDGARWFYGVAGFIVNQWLWIILVLLFLGVAAYKLMVTVPVEPRLYALYKRYRPFIDRLPPFSVYKLFTAFSFLAALSGLLRAGVPPKDSLIQISEHASPFLNDHIDEMLAELTDRPPGEAVTGTGLMTTDAQMSIAIIAQTKDFSLAVEMAASRSIETAESQLSAALNVLVLLAWIVAGTAVAWSSISQFSVVYSLY